VSESGKKWVIITIEISLFLRVVSGENERDGKAN
jgi:hypothetical protein